MRTVVDLTTGQITQAPDADLPVISLSDAKLAIWELIKSRRDTLTQTGGYKVAVGGVDKWFHSDTFSRSQQLGLVMMGANIPANLQWKTMDGTFVTMTQQVANDVFSAAAAQDMAVFSKAEEHRANVNALTDVASVNAYDWTVGWPVTFA